MTDNTHPNPNSIEECYLFKRHKVEIFPATDDSGPYYILGGKKFTTYHHVKSNKELRYSVKHDFQIPPSTTLKEENQRIFERTGAPLTVFRKFRNALNYHVFVRPIPKALLPLVFVRGRLNRDQIASYYKARRRLELCLADGIPNVAPIFMRVDPNIAWNTKDFKEAFGPANWKTICHNKLHRNIAVASAIFNRRIRGKVREDITFLNASSTTILRQFPDNPAVCLAWLSKHRRGKLGPKHKAVNNQFIALFGDTARMLTNNEWNRWPIEILLKMMNWSPRRLQEEHDKAVVARAAIDSDPRVYDWYENFEVKEFVVDDARARLLKSDRELQLEGALMGHCVGIYAPSTKRMRYLVYHLERGFECSTLGISIDIRRFDIRRPITANLEAVAKEPPPFNSDFYSITIHQHHGKYNGTVKDEVLKEIPLKLLEKIRKTFFTKEQNEYYLRCSLS